MNKEEQDYMNQLKAAFEEQKNVKLRELSMTRERYQQLSYTYCKITDKEEMKDFAYISTHEDTRKYYLSDTNLSLIEQINRLVNKKSPIDSCISNGELYANISIPHSLKIDNLYELKRSPQSTLELVEECLSNLLRTILIVLSIILLLRLLSLPLEEIASAYISSHPL